MYPKILGSTDVKFSIYSDVDSIQSRFNSPRKHWNYTQILICSSILSLRVDKRAFEVSSILRSLGQTRETIYTPTK